jgi:hypothetical protein
LKPSIGLEEFLSPKNASDNERHMEATPRTGKRGPEEPSPDRNTLNMVDYYRDALQGFADGLTPIDPIPLCTRKRFVESGVLRRFGSRYELTVTGQGLLRKRA